MELTGAALSMGETAGAVVWGSVNAMVLSVWACARGRGASGVAVKALRFFSRISLSAFCSCSIGGRRPRHEHRS
jgi:hypothetical protein